MRTSAASLLLIAGLAVLPASAMGLRSFVALPLEKGGTVLRPLVEYNGEADTTQLTTELGYGLSANQTLLLALPYRLAGGQGERIGDLSALYRHQLWSADSYSGTTRWSLLGGAFVDRDGKLRPQLGTVATWFHDRHEIDADLLAAGSGSGAPRSGRYDLSWQYRLNPGDRVWWMSVLELGGRWQEGHRATQQLTMGLQRIEGRWVIEGGVVRDLNNDHDTSTLLGVRFHF
ncbi:hypothetical protein [Pseudomonas benzenivorans]|uniref:Uncharacterized protein n=1 Tax=Pseudomonas benzenivorans TaxID=556533 RepID=A0ABY5HAC6_9PSED|nr:hypothetical protein [Pseudomonas benzenivorans]UTW08939.1 hypothetical protein KDW96_06425 [Pseudomonas benzenivorans]